MKLGKVLLLATGVLLLVGTQAFGQPNITAGTIEIGNSVGFEMNKATDEIEGGEDIDYTTTAIALMPRIGYFFTPNISAEATLLVLYGKSKTEQGDNESEYSTTNMGLIATGQYHFVGEGNMVPYVFAGVGMYTNSYDTGAEGDNPEGTEETSLILPAAGAGIKCFMGDHLAIRAETMVMLISNQNGIKDRDGMDISINIGLTGFIGQK